MTVTNDTEDPYFAQVQQAGRETDSLIAGVVLKQTIAWMLAARNDKLGFYRCSMCEWFGEDRCIDTPSKGGKHTLQPFVWRPDVWPHAVPEYTTRIEHAFQLAERFKVGVNPWHGVLGNWVALVHLERGHGLPSALADTPALAICRVVLLAHGRGLLS